MDLRVLCEEISLMETPSKEEETQIRRLAEEVRSRVEYALEMEGIESAVSIEGSLAKGTWLRGDPEIDIFIQLPPSYPREEFGRTIIRIVKDSTKEFESLERYAEHPYLELYAEGMRLNVVPCYKVERGRWISATDRTPYHTEYVKEHLTSELRMDVRLLKRFMRGIDAYGAEIKVGGFSGYLCELLIIHYGSFIDTLLAASKWGKTVFIDLENYYENVEDAVKIFGEPLIVIDPVDETRNVASSVRIDKKSLFTVASRAFLKNPRREFFYPERVKPLSISNLKLNLLNRESTMVFIKFSKPKVIPDVLWGQLHKTKKALSKIFNSYDFKLIRSTVWSDEKMNHILLFEVENGTLPLMKRHLGPPIFKVEDSSKFLKKYINSEATLSGPDLLGDRWVVYIKREYTDVVNLLRDKLKDGGRKTGVPEEIAEAMKESCEILTNMEISKFYTSNPKFAEFLTDFIIGRPRWLDSTLKL